MGDNSNPLPARDSNEPEEGSACCALIAGSVFVAPILTLLLIGLIERFGVSLDSEAEGMVLMAVLGIMVGGRLSQGSWLRRLALAGLATALFLGIFLWYPHRPQWVRELEVVLSFL